MKGKKVDRLPEEIRTQLYQMLESRQFTCQQISDQVNDMLLDYDGETDVDSIDDNTVWREAKRMEQVAEQMREAQTWAESMSEKFDLSQLGEQGRLLLSMLQGAAFKTAKHLMGKSDPIDPETLGDLVLSIQRLQRTSGLTAQLEKEVAERAHKKALAAAADVAEKQMSKGGSEKETIMLLRKAISDIKL